MSPKITLEIAALQDKTVGQLVQRYEEVFKEECRSRNKQYWIRRIAWRVQANEEGGLSRAALKKAEDIQAGKIDCVVVYKVDRLSRSLLDFGRVMETFDKFSVSFVSVTQHFNTTNSMGG